MTDPVWLDGLENGFPLNFDWSVLKTCADVSAMIFRLPNADRGQAFRALHENRGTVGGRVAYHGMMEVWEHDHAVLMDAFDCDYYAVAACLKDVAPPLAIDKPLRVWRGVCVRDGEDPAAAAQGLSWTRSRDVACWFAFRFALHRRPTFVFRADVEPSPRHRVASRPP